MTPSNHSNYLLCRRFFPRKCQANHIATSEKCLQIVHVGENIPSNKCKEIGLNLVDIENDTSSIYLIKKHVLDKNLSTDGEIFFYFEQMKASNDDILWPSGKLLLQKYFEFAVFYASGTEYIYLATYHSSPKMKALCESKPLSVEGDPHFQHYLPELNSYICYDVTGKAGERILLIHHLPTKAKIFGEFRDDYYFGKIVLSTHTNFTLKSDAVWIPGGKINILNDVAIEFLSNTRVIIRIRESDNDELVIDVKKGRNSLTVNHLDLNLLRANKKNLEGIIGFVENTKFEIFKSAQNPNLGSIGKMNRYSPIKRVFRKENDCWLVEFKQILYPFKREHFFSNPPLN